MCTHFPHILKATLLCLTYLLVLLLKQQLSIITSLKLIIKIVSSYPWRSCSSNERNQIISRLLVVTTHSCYCVPSCKLLWLLFPQATTTPSRTNIKLQVYSCYKTLSLQYIVTTTRKRQCKSTFTCIISSAVGCGTSTLSTFRPRPLKWFITDNRILSWRDSTADFDVC